MVILDGKIASQAVKDKLKAETESLKINGKRPPHLAAILVGVNGASETYVASKVKTCKEIGYESTLIRLKETISEEALLKQINELNNDDDIDGILVQLPLPKQISESKIINAVEPSKDVDGFNPVNLGRLVQGLPTFVSATPYGILLLLEYYKISTAGKHAVVIGRSNIVGRPISILLSNNHALGNATVTLCHSHTHNLKEICLTADIIIAAIGKPDYIQEFMVKDGAVVIDVGITQVEDSTAKSGYRIKGDVEFKYVAPITSAITPVPGGVGPMTIAALMKNTMEAYLRRQETKKL